MRGSSRETLPDRFGRSLCLLAAAILLTNLSCSRPGLVREEYSADFYKIPKKLDSNRLDRNPQFIVYGDNRPGWRIKEKFLRRKNWWTWKQLIIPFYQIYWLGNGSVGAFNGLRRVPDYGDKEARWVRDAVYEQAKRSNVDFIINAGDLVTDGRRPKDWKRFLQQYKENVPVVTDFPYLPAVGNHERANDSIYAMPNYRDVLPYPPFYEINCPDIDFFVVDSSVILDEYGYIDDDTQDALFQKWFVSDGDSDESAWLEQKLVSSERKFKVVVMHHPLLSFARHHGSWTDPQNGRGLLSKRQKLLELFRDEGVQVVFNGHQHMYEHNELRYNRESGETGYIHSVITGGGASPLQRGYSTDEIAIFERNYADQGLDVVFIRQEVIYNYCLVDVTSERMTIKVFEVSGKPETNGRLVDTLIIKGRRADPGS